MNQTEINATKNRPDQNTMLNYYIRIFSIKSSTYSSCSMCLMCMCVVQTIQVYVIGFDDNQRVGQYLKAFVIG